MKMLNILLFPVATYILLIQYSKPFTSILKALVYTIAMARMCIATHVNSVPISAN